MGTNTLELVGLVVYILGWVGTLATTIMPHWISQSSDLLVIETIEKGLWETCIIREFGSMECRWHDSMLDLPFEVHLGRICMFTSICVGFLGILMTIPGLNLVKCCKGRVGGEDRTKKSLIIFAGLLAILAAVLCYIPVSYFAHVTVVNFWEDGIPDVVPRWEFGFALFCGWAAGLLLLLAGVLLLSNCLCSQEDEVPPFQRRYQVRNSDTTTGKRTEYV